MYWNNIVCRYVNESFISSTKHTFSWTRVSTQILIYWLLQVPADMLLLQKHGKCVDLIRKVIRFIMPLKRHDCCVSSMNYFPLFGHQRCSVPARSVTMCYCVDDWYTTANHSPQTEKTSSLSYEVTYPRHIVWTNSNVTFDIPGRPSHSISSLWC